MQEARTTASFNTNAKKKLLQITLAFCWFLCVIAVVMRLKERYEKSLKIRVKKGHGKHRKIMLRTLPDLSSSSIRHKKALLYGKVITGNFLTKKYVDGLPHVLHF